VAAKEVELRAALARAEIALTLPRVAAQETEPGPAANGFGRELRNAVERGVILTTGPLIGSGGRVGVP
jgi:hypothetical protein